jgi:hypothetical protein
MGGKLMAKEFEGVLLLIAVVLRDLAKALGCSAPPNLVTLTTIVLLTGLC